MIEDFDLESLNRLVIFTDSAEHTDRTQRELAWAKREAKREGLFADFEISRENTNIVISASSGFVSLPLTLYHYKTLSEEGFKSLSQQIRDLKKIEKANNAVKKLVGSNNMYTPAKRQLSGKPTIQFNLGEKQPAKISPELEASLARQKALIERRLAIKK